MKKIIILGKGGHAKSLVDTIERQGVYEIAGYVINEQVEIDSLDYPIIGSDLELKKIYQSGIHNAAIGIGYLGKGTIREILYKQLKEIGFYLPVIIDLSAVVSDKVIIEEGAFIGKGVVLNSGAQIGKMCIINTGAIIEHDCYVEEFSHIAVNAVLCGGVHVGKAGFVGANATVIQGRYLQNRCVVGAGELIK